MPKKFIICSQPRTGSHMLRSALDSHPDLAMADEPFVMPETDGLPAEAAMQFAERKFSQPMEAGLWERIDFLGQIFTQFDGFILHRVFVNPWRYVLNALADNVRIVYLRRRNLLRQFCSHELMFRPGVDRDEPIELDLTRLKTHLLEWAALDRMFVPILAPYHVHEVVYEDLCDHYDKQINGVQRFLGVDPVALVPSTKRLETRPLSEIIANFREVEEMLYAYRFPFRWDRFLDAPATVDLA